MRIPVLVEPISQSLFRASTGEPLKLEAEGGSRDDAIRQLRELLRLRVDGGAELVGVEVPATKHPLVSITGSFKDDPLLDEWREAVEEYREQVERDPDAL